jgi:hypothetical protein
MAILKKLEQAPASAKVSNPNYFNDDTEKSVILYQDELDPQKKNDIFATQIKPALAKLIENIIYVYKFHLLRGR